MLIPIYYLKDCLIRLSNLSKNLDRENISEDVLANYRNTFYTIILDIKLPLEELSFFMDGQPRNNFSYLRRIISRCVEAQEQDFTAENLKTQIDIIIEQGQIDELSNYSKYDYDYTVREIFDTVRPIPRYDIECIANSFSSSSDREVAIFDPSTEDASAIGEFAGNCPFRKKVYAAGISTNFITVSKTRANRIAIGPLKGSTISNDVFDVVLVRPKIEDSFREIRVNEKIEKDIIRDSLRYIRPDGYIVLCMPFFRFSKDICLMLSKAFTDVQIYKTEFSFRTNGYIYVIGKRKASKEMNPEAYETLRSISSIDDVPVLTDALPPRALPNDTLEVKIFRGSILDKDEVKELYVKSQSTADFWGKQEIAQEDEKKKSPLLPFSLGQIGLILTSGCLDGIVDEGNGCAHLIKGRVVKVKDKKTEYKEDTTEISTITNNRVEINIIFPDGTHRSLVKK